MNTTEIAGMAGGTCMPTPAPQVATGKPVSYAARVPVVASRTTGVDRLLRERVAGFGTTALGSTGPGAHPV